MTLSRTLSAHGPADKKPEPEQAETCTGDLMTQLWV
jgi:hypothetical protein